MFLAIYFPIIYRHLLSRAAHSVHHFIHYVYNNVFIFENLVIYKGNLSPFSTVPASDNKDVSVVPH